MTPCRIFRLPDGASGFMCSPRHAPGTKHCYVCCSRPGTFLCDWPIRDGEHKNLGPVAIEGDDGKLAISGMEFDGSKTCDKPMCERCRNEVSPGVDYCNAHYRMHLAKETK